MISKQAYHQAAQKIGCDVAAIQAVAYVESKEEGFIHGQPVILFERHVFHKLTQGKYDFTHPEISNKKPGGYGTYIQQHQRLQQACALDRVAALSSASWGKFQIMGFNFKAAGFTDLQSFINAMYQNEEAHLQAFVNFIINQGLANALQKHDWQRFAQKYNGADYKTHQYDIQLAKAYKKYTELRD